MWKIRIKDSHVDLAIVIAAVLIVSATALALPVKPVNPIATGCFVDSSVSNPSQGACGIYLSATSGSPGTMVTVDAMNFRDLPLDAVNAYPTMPDQSIPQYSIHLQQASSMIPTDVVVSSGNLECGVYCNMSTDTFFASGSFSTTFVVPKVAPGTYNVVVTITYAPNVDAYSSGYLDYSESAIATFTVT